MLFEDTLMQAIIARFRQDATNYTAEELRSVLTMARLGKPVDLDEVSAKVEQLYHGRSKALLEKALKERFPNTKIEQFPIAALNLMRMFARADAGVYQRPADRWLDDENGDRIPADDDRSELWCEQLRKARFGPKMQEIERRTLIPPKCVIGEVTWWKPPGDPVGYPHIQLYYPHDVEVLCHWQASSFWPFKWMIALRQARPTPRAIGEWWKVYSRAPPDDVDGTWGDWYVATSSTNGEQAQIVGTPEKYAGKIAPVFLIQPEDPEGSIFANIDQDLIDVVIGLNVQRIDEVFTLGMQGHSQMWTDDPTDMAVLKTGVDAMLKVSPGRTIQALAYNPPLTDARESRKLFIRETAIARGNSPHVYDDQGAVPPSGIAKKIDQMAHDARVAESQEIFQVLEEEEPLAVLHDVVSTFHPKRALLKGTKPRMRPRRALAIEDPSQRQLRLEAAVDRSFITPERAATEAEYYESLEEATAALADIKAKEPPPPPPPPPPSPTLPKVEQLMRNDPQAKPGSVPQPPVDPGADNAGGSGA